MPAPREPLHPVLEKRGESPKSEHRLMRRRKEEGEKEGRKEECSLVSVVLVQRMERLALPLLRFSGAPLFLPVQREKGVGG